jgi:TfoX/Sxy family transcriptional regulator of competence genes
MFGGLTFRVGGHMCCGVLSDRLVLRLGEEGAREALSEPFTHPMDFTGRPAKGFVYLDAEAVRTRRVLQKWLSLAVRFTMTLPPRDVYP